MSEERKAVVHENELEAIKDSRWRDLPLFSVVEPFFEDGTDKPLYVVAVSDHQAKLALVDRVFPLEKCTKKERDERYTELLERAMSEVEKDKKAFDEATDSIRGALGSDKDEPEAK